MSEQTPEERAAFLRGFKAGTKSGSQLTAQFIRMMRGYGLTDAQINQCLIDAHESFTKMTSEP